MHLVGLYTYCKMMHGAYNVRLSKLVVKGVGYFRIAAFCCKTTVKARKMAGIFSGKPCNVAFSYFVQCDETCGTQGTVSLLHRAGSGTANNLLLYNVTVQSF